MINFISNYYHGLWKNTRWCEIFRRCRHSNTNIIFKKMFGIPKLKLPATRMRTIEMCGSQNVITILTRNVSVFFILFFVFIKTTRYSVYNNKTVLWNRKSENRVSVWSGLSCPHQQNFDSFALFLQLALSTSIKKKLLICPQITLISTRF